MILVQLSSHTHTYILQLRDEIICNGEDVQFGQGLQVLYSADAVVCKTEVGQIGQVRETRDGGNVVEGEVQPLQLCEALQPLHLLNDVVVQLKVAKPSKLPQILNVEDVCGGDECMQRES